MTSDIAGEQIHKDHGNDLVFQVLRIALVSVAGQPYHMVHFIADRMLIGLGDQDRRGPLAGRKFADQIDTGLEQRAFCRKKDDQIMGAGPLCEKFKMVGMHEAGEDPEFSQVHVQKLCGQ